MKKLTILFFVSIISFSSCLKYVNYKHFTLGREQLVSNALLKKGFYFYTDNEEKKGDTTTKYEIYFLYEDGTVGKTGYLGNNIKDYCEKLKNNLIFKNSEKSYLDKFKRWGKYKISGNYLLIQSFELYSEVKYGVYEHIGNTTSNSSFVINAEGFLTSSSESVKPLKKPCKFIFYPCENCKPDSTNWLMKKFGTGLKNKLK